MALSAQLRRQLKARDIATIHLGLDAASDEAVVELLEGVTVEGGKLTLNRTFRSGDDALPYRSYAVLWLLHRADDPRRARLTDVTLSFATTEPGPLDLSFLGGLKALSALELGNAAGAQSLPPLPQLQSLTLTGACGLDLASTLAVPLEHLCLHGQPLDEAARSTLRGQPDLRLLELVGCAGVEALAELPPVPSLTVRDCPDLADVGALRTTMLRRLELHTSVETVTIDDAPFLSELIVEGPTLAGALRAPGLARLTCTALPDPAPLADISTLVSVSIGSWPGDSLAPLAASDELAALTLEQAPELADLSALGGKDALESLRLHHAHALTELAPLGSCASLSRVDIGGAGHLLTLEGLRGSPALTELSLPECGLLQEVDALETVETLRRLDLSGCIGLHQVEGVRALPALEEVTLPFSRGKAKRVYQGEELAGLKARLTEAHAKRAALEEGDPMVVRVRKLLMHEDLYHQRQALEVMRSFGTDFADEVLGDCRIGEDGELFTPFGDPSESLLLALAESGKVPRPLRRLVLRGSRFGRLDVLKQLSDLEELELEECSQLGSLDGIEHCQKLRALTITHCHRLRDVSALRWARSLESLSIVGKAAHRGMLLASPINTAALRALSTLAYLEHLDVSGCGTLELSVLAQMPRLKTLKATALTPQEGFGRIGHLTKLEALELEDCERLEDLHALQRMPGLRRLLLAGAVGLRNVDPLGSLTELEHLTIGGEHIRDASALGRLTKLRFLALERCAALEDLGFLPSLGALETLYLDGAPITSLRALSGLTALTRLTLQNLRHLTTLDGIELCQSLETVEVETGCAALRYADALLELPALKRLVLLEGSVFLVPPEERDRIGQGGAVRVGPYRARLRAALNKRQHITCEAFRAALDQNDAEKIASEIADLEAFSDPRLLDAVLRATAAGGSGRPRGGLLGGGSDPLTNHALIEALRVGIGLGHARSRDLAARLTAPLPVPGGEAIVPSSLLGGA